MKGKAIAEFANLLLKWYDTSARDMPWRVGPAARSQGIVPEPYHVWLSEIMLQQTTVATVGPYFRDFVTTWPNIEALACAEDDAVMAAWAGLGYYSRARNLLKCARAIVAEGKGFPRTQSQLQKLPGIGPYTSAAISAIAFDAPAAVVDGNVERVMARLFEVETPLPNAKPELTAHAASLTPSERPGDYAQAVMDLGATICTPRNPKCPICPIEVFCQASKNGTTANLPRKTPKPDKPTRLGDIYVACFGSKGAVLERRPEKGLLGGMLGFPGSIWAETHTPTQPPFAADWAKLPNPVRHVFTHFRLELTVHTARLTKRNLPPTDQFVLTDALDPSTLPTVMRKTFAAANAAQMESS